MKCLVRSKGSRVCSRYPGLIEPEVMGFGAKEEVPQALDLYLAKVLEKYLQQYLKIIATDDRFPAP